MPIINVTTGSVSATVDPMKKVSVSGLWNVASTGGGYTALTCPGSNAIVSLLQGEFVVPASGQPLISPYWFGGILPNNDANQYAQVIQGEYGVTTTMPNSQSPLVNYVICEGQYIAEVVRVIDDENIVLKDPSGIVALLSVDASLTGFSAISYPIRNVTLNVNSGSTMLVWLPGQAYITAAEGTITLTPNSYGDCAPIMVQADTGTAILIYNE